LHKLARGLGVPIEELFRPPGVSSARQFDRATNSIVQTVVARNAPAFENWSDADFDELFSRFGTGGQLTEAGVLETAEAMNTNREILRRVGIVLESGEATLLAEFVEMLYRRATAPHRGDNSR
jgi:hypothetical protein